VSTDLQGTITVCVHNKHVTNFAADCPWCSSHPPFSHSAHSEMPRHSVDRPVHEACSTALLLTRSHVREERNPKNYVWLFRSSPKVTSCPLCSVPLSSVYFAQVVLGPTVHITMDDKHNPDITSSKEVSLPQWTAEPNKTSKKWRPLLAMAALSALALYTLNPSPLAEPARGIRCPYQPEPLHPKIAWDMTKDEKARSADIFSQAVVCHPSGWKGVS
jgi:hypothetical protein